MMGGMIRKTVALALVVLTGFVSSAQAQNWSSGNGVDGSWFYAYAGPPTPSLGIACGGLLGQDTRPGERETHPLATPGGAFALILNTALLPGTDTAPRDDIRLAVMLDAQGFTRTFRLPALRYLPEDGFHRQILDMNDALFANLQNGLQVTVRAGDRNLGTVPLVGSTNAIRAMFSFCQQRWVGRSTEPLARTVLERPAPRAFTESDAQIRAQGFCNGPAQVDPRGIILADVDGDQADDLILDMRSVTCTAPGSMGYGAGMCGASQCSSFVYLTRNPDADPADILSLGVEVVRGPDGQPLIRAIAGLGTCAAEGYQGCHYLFDARGGTLRMLGLFPTPSP